MPPSLRASQAIQSRADSGLLRAQGRAAVRTAGSERVMKVIGLAGWSGAGKTTLVVAGHPAVSSAQGLRVSVIKHAHHKFRRRRAGQGFLGAPPVRRRRRCWCPPPTRWALMHELRGAAEPRLPELLAKMSRGRSGRRRRLQIRAASQDRGASRGQRQAAICSPTIPRYRGIATDAAVETALPVAHLDDIEAVAAMMRQAAMPVEDLLARSAGES